MNLFLKEVQKCRRDFVLGRGLTYIAASALCHPAQPVNHGTKEMDKQ